MSKVLKVNDDIYDKVRKKSEKEEVTLKDAVSNLVTVTEPEKNPVTVDGEKVTSGNPKKSKAKIKTEKAKRASISSGNWLLFTIIGIIVVLTAFFVAREIRKGSEGNGGSKVESPQSTPPVSSTPKIPEDRAWASE